MVIYNEKMSIESAIKSRSPLEGSYPEKPNDAKSVAAWLKEGRIPISEGSVEVFAMVKGGGYYYVREQNTREMTPQEQEVYSAWQQARAQEKKNKALQSKTEKIEKPTAKPKLRRPAQKIKTQYVPNFSNICGKNIVAIDTETTGFSPDKGDELLEVGIAKWEDGKTTEAFESLLKPHEKTEWTGAMIKNHISPKMVQNAPYPEDVAAEVQDVVNQADVVVMYNADFDKSFLEQCMGIDFSKVLIVDPSEYFRQESPSGKHALGNCVEKYAPHALAKYEAGAHSAYVDAAATLEALAGQAKESGHDLSVIPPSIVDRLGSTKVESACLELLKDIATEAVAFVSGDVQHYDEAKHSGMTEAYDQVLRKMASSGITEISDFVEELVQSKDECEVER